MFVPDNGSVIYPYVAPISTSLACLKTGRACVSIEKRDVCFSEAMIRVRYAAGPKQISLEFPGNASDVITGTVPPIQS